MPNTINHPEGPFTVYAAGEMFSQNDLSANAFLKEAIWRLSEGRFILVLPQSKELRQLELSKMAANIRNQDLRNVMQADLVLARYDGLELDSGTVVEYMFAKFLGKPAVILRSDSRRMSTNNFDEPYNLMTKNWPRTVQIHKDALIGYSNLYIEAQKSQDQSLSDAEEHIIEVEVAKKGIEILANEIIAGLNAALELPSPYPPQETENAYKLARLSAGKEYCALVNEEALGHIIKKLRTKGTL